MENKKTKFLAFIAGHGHKSVLNKTILTDYLSKKVEGYVCVDIPSQIWKGFGFVYVDSQKNLDAFLAKKFLTINGCQIQVKIFKQGTNLKSQKLKVQSRRLFVRVFSKKRIDVDVETIFSQFGRVETGFLVDSSQTFEDGKYTMIGYILFFDKKVTDSLVKKKLFIHDGLKFVMKKTKQRELTQKKGQEK